LGFLKVSPISIWSWIPSLRRIGSSRGIESAREGVLSAR
jgi:hypothetical protein